MKSIRKPLVKVGLDGSLVALAIGLATLVIGAQAADDAAIPAKRINGDVPSGPRSSQSKPASDEPASTPHIEGGQVNGRWREGSRLVDQLGYFKLSGEHVTFISSDGKLKFDGLENLAVERIARMIGDSPDQLQWSISGIITECRGSNYLLVTQAVLKTKSARPRRSP